MKKTIINTIQFSLSQRHMIWVVKYTLKIGEPALCTYRLVFSNYKLKDLEEFRSPDYTEATKDTLLELAAKVPTVMSNVPVIYGINHQYAIAN